MVAQDRRTYKHRALRAGGLALAQVRGDVGVAQPVVVGRGSLGLSAGLDLLGLLGGRSLQRRE